jgi:hypothetical protein
LLEFPFGANLRKKNAGADRKRKADAWSESMAAVLKADFSSGPVPANHEEFDEDDFESAPNSNEGAKEQELRARLLAKKEYDRALAAATAAYRQAVPADAKDDEEAPEPLPKRPRRPTKFFDDDDEEPPSTGLLALDKFMKSIRLTIERSLYIDFASISKERLDQLQVLGVGSASSKRLNASTIMVTSASEGM